MTVGARWSGQVGAALIRPASSQQAAGRAISFRAHGKLDKVKCGKRDAFPIVAFVEKLGAKPRKIASLYVGRREGDRLLYAGRVRSGYTEAVARDLRERLDPFIRKNPPLSEPVKSPRRPGWSR
jgi:ATP-dependent DNA ligase